MEWIEWIIEWIKEYYVIEIFAFVVSLFAINIAYSTRNDSYRLKKHETFNAIGLSREIFIGRLIAFGFTEKDIEKDGLTIDILRYYSNLLNAIWIGNKIENHSIRVRMRFPLYSMISYEKKVKKARKMDDKKRFFHKKTQIGRVIRSEKFRIAWTKYLKKFWARNNTAKTAVLIEASLLNQHKSI